MNTFSNDHSELLVKLSDILEDVLSQGATDLSDRDIANDSFAVLGVNSVDFLEFVLNVEHDLGLDIPDEALMDPDLNSVRQWATYIANRGAAGG